jgi:hypothetical protein
MVVMNIVLKIGDLIHKIPSINTNLKEVYLIHKDGNFEILKIIDNPGEKEIIFLSQFGRTLSRINYDHNEKIVSLCGPHVITLQVRYY